MKLTLRARITVLFVGTVLGVGLLLIGLVYAYLKLTPVPFQASFPVEEDGLVIDAAVPVTEEILRVILGVSLTALALLTAISGVVGWFVAGLVIRPLSQIADTAREVTAGDLSTRIDYAGPRDEVAELADALDVMLDSVEGAVEKQKRFAANASHELKTPIATIQTMADVELADPHPDSMRTTLERIREVNAANAETVAALLQLAHLSPAFEPVDLGEIASSVAAAHGIACTAEPLLIDASPPLIHQAIDNLARNAASHGIACTAAMRMFADGGSAVVEVSNAGAVIEAPETLAEPFARTRTSRGHGLGLALVKAIAEAHGGALELEAPPAGGLIARVRVPARRGSALP